MSVALTSTATPVSAPPKMYPAINAPDWNANAVATNHTAPTPQANRLCARRLGSVRYSEDSKCRSCSGLVTSTLLTLLMLPTVYGLLRRRSPDVDEPAK